MIISKTKGKRILLVHDLCDHNTLDESALDKLSNVLGEHEIEVLTATTAFDAEMMIVADPMIQAILLDWDLAEDNTHQAAKDVLNKLRSRAENVPVFLFADRADVADIPLEVLKETSDFIWLYEDTANFIAGRIEAAIDTYLKNLLPPMFKALAKFSQVHEYSWHTPGHTGGTAFMKAPAGRAYFDFFGENLFRSDLSISVGELGSLLDHSGPIGASEKYAAKVFGAHRTYHVTNGSSTSNRVIFMACVTHNQVALCDRNCHKSIEQAMTMSGAIPNYMMPLRNFYGIIGPIPPQALQAEAIKKTISENSLITKDIDSTPVHAIVTNSTYDGLLYNTDWIKQTLDVPSIHFDSAWVPYTHFHPIYQGKSGMSGERVAGKVIFETQSTHKMLAALSQASLIHIKGEYDEEAFNEAFMMHTTTSPSYPIVASVETAAAMLRGNPGKRLINRSVERALHFRKEVQRLREESDGWFFDIWQPPQVDEAECWPVAPGEQWHGFNDADADHMFLDPVKVTILTPGMDEQGNMSEEGIPAALVAKFLDERGIVVEKTGPYNLLFLFSIGIDKTKAMGLLRGLTEFKRSYDLNLRIKNMLPDLYAEDPDFYRNMRIQDLAQGIHKLIRKHDLPGLMLRAFDTLPEMIMTPHQAWQRQIKGEVETIALEQLVGRVSANMILPYPPGVPLLMPGEMLTKESRTVLDFLLMLCSVGQHYPGFETDIHGAKQDEDGVYRVRVLKMAG